MQGISAALYHQLHDICIKEEYGPAVLAAGAGCLFSGFVMKLSLIGAIYFFSLSVFLLETIWYRLKYCLKQPNQSNNHKCNPTLPTPSARFTNSDTGGNIASGQRHNFPAGTWRRNDVLLTPRLRHIVASTSVRRHSDVMSLLD